MTAYLNPFIYKNTKMFSSPDPERPAPITPSNNWKKPNADAPNTIRSNFN